MGLTHSHRTSQRRSSGHLSVEQRNAIDLLVTGRSDREVAEAVGVARETVTRWRNGNPYFTAELNRQRRELWGASQDRLRALVPRAVDALEAAIEAGNIKAAVEVLKAVRVYGEVSPPRGLEDPELIVHDEAMAWAREEMKRRGRGDDLLLPDLNPFGAERDRLAEARFAELKREKLDGDTDLE